MKLKKLLVLFLAAVVAAVAFALPASAASLKAPTSVTAEVQNETSVKISWKKAANGKLSAYSKTVKAVPAVVVKPEIELKLKSTAVKKDYKGDDFLLVTYKFKQNTDEAKAFYLMVNDTAYQDGIELDSMVISNDLDSTAAISKVMPGVEIEVQQGYKLRNGESDVQIICTKLLDYKDKTPLLEKTIEL